MRMRALRANVRVVSSKVQNYVAAYKLASKRLVIQHQLVLQATIGLESCHHVINGHFVCKLIYLGLLVSHLSMRTFATAALYALPNIL